MQGGQDVPMLETRPTYLCVWALSVTYDFVNLAVSRASFNPRMRLKKHPLFLGDRGEGCFPFPCVVFLLDDPSVAGGGGGGGGGGCCSHYDDRDNWLNNVSRKYE